MNCFIEFIPVKKTIAKAKTGFSFFLYINKSPAAHLSLKSNKKLVLTNRNEFLNDLFVDHYNLISQ